MLYKSNDSVSAFKGLHDASRMHDKYVNATSPMAGISGNQASCQLMTQVFSQPETQGRPVEARNECQLSGPLLADIDSVILQMRAQGFQACPPDPPERSIQAFLGIPSHHHFREKKACLE